MFYFFQKNKICTHIIFFLLVCQLCIKFAIGECDINPLSNINDNSNDFIEGDIKMKSRDVAKLLKAYAMDPFSKEFTEAVEPVTLWENGIIPYKFSSELQNDPLAVSIILKAFDILSSKTCLKFSPANDNEGDYVLFTSDDDCFSYIGKQGGVQEVSIGPDCAILGIVLHELLHLSGKWHEHSRYDRHSHIKINYENIIPGTEPQFNVVPHHLATTQNLPYDFNSVMHYDQFAFSDNNKPTITTFDKSKQSLIGQRAKLSKHDIEHINILYNCDKTDTKTSTSNWSEWNEWTKCSKSCENYLTIRTRSCKSKNNDCGDGDNFETKPCGNSPCEVESYWGDWKQWSLCSKKCGTGKRFRIRECIEGDTCNGDRLITEECTGKDCKKAQWSGWNEWGDCSAICGGGNKIRTRQCSLNGKCKGHEKSYALCNSKMCDETSTPELKGLQNEGCFYFTAANNLKFSKKGSSHSFHHHDNHANHHHKHDHKSYHKYQKEAEKAIIKCAKEAIKKSRPIFAIISEFCILEDKPPFNNLTNFIQANSTSCSDGVGNFEERLSMDVWSIQDEDFFNKKGKRHPRGLINSDDNDDDDIFDSDNCRQKYLDSILGIRAEASNGATIQTGHFIQSSLFICLVIVLLAILY